MKKMNLKTRIGPNGKYHFASTADLIQLWITFYYFKKVVVVIKPASIAFEIFPELYMLKRDNLTVFLQGTESEIAFITFENFQKALDWCFSLKHNKEVTWEIFDNGKKVEQNK